MILRPGEEPVPGYRLQQRLGRGAIGEVWRASGPGNTSVALKFVNLAGKPAIKELRALQHVKQVRHANLTPIHAFWMLSGGGDVLTNEAIESYYAETSRSGRTPHGASRPSTLIIAMQIGDKSLADRLDECREQGLAGIPVEELLGYMEDAAKGLDFLNAPRHDLGSGPVAIQHCDVKPQNILLMGDSASVCDFGLARVLGESHTTSAMAGSPAYMAPECIEGPKPSGATDQYALAISFAELRTGQLPFRELNYGEVLNAHLTGGLCFDRLEPGEAAVARRATSRDPANRFPSSVVMVRALRRVVEGGSLSVSGSFSGTNTGSMFGATVTGDSVNVPSSFDSPGGAPAAHAPAPPRGPGTPTLAGEPARAAFPSVAGDVGSQKMRIVELSRAGQFEAAAQATNAIAGMISPEELAQIRTALANRWFTAVVHPLVERCDYMGALAAIEAAPAALTAPRRAEWLIEIKSRWTRFAADQLKRGRGK